MSNTIIKVNGLEIDLDGLYLIQNKPDHGAPSGFQKEGTTKLPSGNISNSISCKFRQIGSKSGEGIYDTGFYVGSPCYAGLSTTEKEAKVKSLHKHIVEPFEAIRGEGILDHDNFEFWDSYWTQVKEGRVLNAKDPISLLDLYMMIHTCAVEPESGRGNPKFRSAQYKIVDKSKASTIQVQRANHYMDSIKNFGVLLETEKPYLINMLRYLGVPADSKLDDKTLQASFLQWLDQGDDQPIRFQKVFEFSQKQATKEIPNLYVLASEALKRKKIVQGEMGYEFDGLDIGSDLKTVAKNLTNKKYKDVVISLTQLIEG